MRVVGHFFEPDCLPDPGSPRIPDGMWMELPVLLAARLGQIVWIVGRAGPRPRSSRHRACQICGEWTVATPVVGDRNAIGPDGRFIIDGSEVKDEPFARNRDSAV